MNKNKAAHWFAVAIANGIQRLMVLNLENTPAARTVELTTSTWIDTLWKTRAWDAALDETRISEAFRQLALSSERWPAPVHFLRRLPGRPQPLKLTAPKPTKAQRAKYRAIIEQAKESLSRDQKK
jgi:hypothetical protein